MAAAGQRISVLMPTYNGGRFIAAQIESILSQTLADIDLLICDDGSGDDTLSIVEDFARADRRVSILPSSGNRGQRFRLSCLVDATSEPLVAFADQDDVWDEGKLERLRDALGDRSMAFGSSHLIGENGHALGSTIADRTGHPPRDGDRLAYLFRPYASAHAALVRRDAVTAMAFHRLAHFDWLMSLDAAFRSGIVFVPEAVVRHRMHGHNQANAGFASADGWWSPFHPVAIYGALQRKRMRRFTFASAVEHLAFSPSLPPAAQRDFGRIGALCRGAWFDPGISRPFANARLARSLLALLEPHAGSEGDLDAARRQLAALTRI